MAMTGWGSPRPTAGDQVWDVGALLRALADALQARFNPVTVRGEVSGFSRAASGHCYFSLKDEAGQIRCAMFKRVAQSCAVDLRDGQSVEVQGRLDIYGPRGDLQLIAEGVRLAGQGSLFEQFLRNKAELEAQGLFDPARKRALPVLPRSLGVVTSPDAAALRDVATVLARRVPHLPVLLFPSLVQGDQAPASLCQALQAAYNHYHEHGAPEVLLLVRGGGSLEDLWAFNNPAVVRLLAQAPMPVVSGVGHETDFTLVDFVADLRAATPTAAAELCAPARDTQLCALDLQADRLRQVVWRALDVQAQGLDRLTQRLGRPSARLSQENAKLVALAHRLQHAVRRRLDLQTHQLQLSAQQLPVVLARDTKRQRQTVEHLGARLSALDPHLVLQRGYAWLCEPTGHAITSVAQTHEGQPLRAVLADGEIGLTVSSAGN